MATRPNPAPARPGYTPRVAVKFLDNLQLPYEDNLNDRLDEMGIGSWKELTKRFPGISMRRMYTSVKPEELQRLITTASRRDPTYKPRNLLNYFVIDCSGDVNPDELAKVLSAWRNVEKAYFDPPGSEPLVNPADDPRSVNQGYLDPAPSGIDAEYAWGFAGGDGAGQQVVDLERGWTLNHEDLNAHGATLIHGGMRDGSRPHGTAVLGEICAFDNALGCVGITPNVASVQVTSYWASTRPDAMAAAIAVLPFGGVLLLEAQLNVTVGAVTWVNMPIEALDAEYDTIRLATALGITVVEAAGNGSNDLDTFADAGGNQILNRGSADFRDSGAIMVGAATSTVPHSPMPFTNFGSRIDCYAWGENVDTATSNTVMPFDTTSYTGTFNGTSSASPIITGAALALQGISEAASGFRFNPGQLRAMLSDAATGTASANPAVDRIGVMPNLRAIIDGNVIGVSPDVYLRDFVGDTGDPHAGAISASPDVILRKTAVADPQTAFGEGSGTENDASLGFEAEAGQDNFIYVRMRNRGGSDAVNVTATVYWSPVATLVTPDLWTLVGSVNLPLVPPGNVLTVSNGITWPAAAIPGTGHYCLVGLAGTAGDPAPNPATLFDWDTFRAFVRNNNNVTWRNFNVVDNDPDPAVDPDFVALPFLAVGAPERSLRMGLRAVARLPRGAKAMLEVPLHLREVFQQFGPFRVDEKRKVFRIPLNPQGVRPLPELLFPAKARIPLRMLVHIPKEHRGHAYQVYVTQHFREEEVGRVTWQLMKRRKK
ncbi:MAG: S8 family serine peptidase [Bryobacterales bacterium]|nr:S8 family serine peptidase [Bryobacterales bacterium]